MYVFYDFVLFRDESSTAFRVKNPENQYMSHKKYGVHLRLSEPSDLVCFAVLVFG